MNMHSRSSAHAYVSIRTGGVRAFNTPRGAGSVIFVDISTGGDLDRIRELPSTVLREPRAHLLFRTATDDTEEQLKTILGRWDLAMPAWLLAHPLGRPAEVTRLDELGGEIVPDLAAARAIELEALLEWGKALWRPEAYHYRLPSGEHAAEFVKVSDSIRAPRDARVLATWLLELMRPQTGIVVDTGTLTPVIEAVQRMMVEAGQDPGPVAVLDQYPRTSIDVDTAVEHAAGDSGKVVALVSVNSSGAVRDRIAQAINRQEASLDEPRIVVMVDKHEPPAHGSISTWSPLPGEEPLLRPGSTNQELCPLCRDSKRARIIAINPYTFDGMTPGQPRPIMPSIADASANSGLWEVCSGHDAIAVESRSAAPTVPALRPTGPMPIRVRLAELIGKDDFRELARSGLQAAIERADPAYRSEADLVLVPQHEMDWAGFAEFWSEIAPLLAPGREPLGFSIEGDGLGTEALERLAEANVVTIFALGVVSGWSLQKALISVQHAHPLHDLDLQGVVLHARPPNGREWETLRNSFGSFLHAGFTSILPDRSPLKEELGLLKNLDRSGLSPGAVELSEQRIRLCNGESEPDKLPASLFYGVDREAELSRNSFYGQRLHARSVYAAVGSAMARARDRDAGRSAPEFRVFDLAGISRSYYDKLILASIFRWLHPHESWWGWQSPEVERVVATLLERADAQDEVVLVPELLLACAQGKVHERAVDTIFARADQVATGAEPAVAAAVELTRALAERSLKSDSEAD